MFTGLVETIGILKGREVKGEKGTLKVLPLKPFSDLKIGESIAINGVCLTLATIIENDNAPLTFNVLAESFKRTNLGMIKIGSEVNMERALSVGDRLGGHMVQGHVDGVGTVLKWDTVGRDKVLRVKYPEELKPFFIEKGSVALDGISLTIVDLDDTSLSVHIIPTTYEETCLKNRRVGDLINLETDVIGKYVYKFMSAKETGKSKISINTLAKAGWEL